MFSFRHDKVGFFSGIALIVICGGTFIATLVLLIVGATLGDYQRFLWPIRWVVFGWWLACIAVVLTRVYIKDWQMRQGRRTPDAAPAPQSAAVAPVPLTPEAEVALALARADQERYRAIGAIGVATVLGVASALAIVTFLNAGVPDLPGATPVQIVAWSVGGGVIVVVVLLCVIGLRRGSPYAPRFSAPPPRETAATGVQQPSTRS
jgi:O-antigen/teichoic acid export membrane protein